MAINYPPIHVVDSIMGSGKTSAAINTINASVSTGKRYIFVTPYLQQVHRIIHSCPAMDFQEPIGEPTKLTNVKALMASGANIATTHALFSLFDDKATEIIREMRYTLIIDEAPKFVTGFEESLIVHGGRLSAVDVDMFIAAGYVRIENTTLHTGKTLHRLVKSGKPYLGSLISPHLSLFQDWNAYSVNKGVVLLAKPERLACYEEIFLMTYQFANQEQCGYFRFYNIPFDYMHIAGDNIHNFRFVEGFVPFDGSTFRDLIHILDNRRMNKIGESRTALSQSWYKKNLTPSKYKTKDGKQLKNNIVNYYRNIMSSPVNNNMWTSFKAYKDCLSGGGFGGGFVALNARATNEHRDRDCLAYTVNRFMRPLVKVLFSAKGISLDEGEYALAEMLQWLFRSAIRDDKPVDIYIPSSRMRGILSDWLNNKALDDPEYALPLDDYTESDWGEEFDD